MAEKSKQEAGDGLDILILGGGIAGLATALALTKFAPRPAAPPRIRIFEIRPAPAAQGGAINLTPNALRLLDHLGVWAVLRARAYGCDIDELEVWDAYAPARPLAVSSFRGPAGAGLGSPPYKALRVTRGDVLRALLEAVAAHANIALTCGARTVAVAEGAAGVRLEFADGTAATGALLLGCDGIHSAARRLHVDPGRAATYTGVCNAFGFADAGRDAAELPPLHFGVAALNFARRGILLTSYHDPAMASVYVGALIEVADGAGLSRDGWRQAGADAARTRADLLARFGDARLPCLRPLVERVDDFYLWPVFTLSKEGTWSTNRCMLLGDAAHAMPPQGESTGIVFEDTVIFARCLARWLDKGRPGGHPGEAFAAYERLRRPRIAAAFEESRAVVSSVADVGWLGHYIKTWIIPWYIWFTRGRRDRHFVEDVTRSELDY